jgi:hypothetical protein
MAHATDMSNPRWPSYDQCQRKHKHIVDGLKLCTQHRNKALVEGAVEIVVGFKPGFSRRTATRRVEVQVDPELSRQERIKQRNRDIDGMKSRGEHLGRKLHAVMEASKKLVDSFYGFAGSETYPEAHVGRLEFEHLQEVLEGDGIDERLYGPLYGVTRVDDEGPGGH